MGMGFAPTWLRQVRPLLHKTTLTTDSAGCMLCTSLSYTTSCSERNDHVIIQTRSVDDKDKLVIAAELRFIQLRKEIQHHNVLTEDAIWKHHTHIHIGPQMKKTHQDKKCALVMSLMMCLQYFLNVPHSAQYANTTKAQMPLRSTKLSSVHVAHNSLTA